MSSRKLFEVPYNFSKKILPFYKKNEQYINFLFLPPYKDDLINTRTNIETKQKGHCYMPVSREEYENHLAEIVKAGLRFVVLWQTPHDLIDHKMLDYYCNLGAAGFIIANDANAYIIKKYNPRLLVICSLVQRVDSDITKRDFSLYDYIILYYTFNRSLNVLKQITQYRDKIVLMPNTFCNIDCPSVHHWFANKEHPFVHERDCMVLRYPEKYPSKSGFISPHHLFLFDDYVAGYKLEGREYTTDLIEYICDIFFNRKDHHDLLNNLLGKDLAEKFFIQFEKQSLEQYYNTNTPNLASKIK